MPPKAKKVATPGSYRHVEKNEKEKGKKKKQSEQRESKKKKQQQQGRPPTVKCKKPARKIKLRRKYTVEDMKEAVRLVQEDGYSMLRAAAATNDIKKNAVPRITLLDWLHREEPMKEPALGRPQELSKAVEAALVKCLTMCGDFQYPMRKKDLQELVQAYCIENNVQTRWEDSMPGKGWIRKFKERWRHAIKIRRPKHIKRARSKVSPSIVRSFFDRVAVNLEDVPAANIFNYDETNFQVGSVLNCVQKTIVAKIVQTQLPRKVRLRKKKR